jgi:SNF2 family DNA or RNA helicase
MLSSWSGDYGEDAGLIMVERGKTSKSIDELFASIREACTSKHWSRGIELSRKCKISREDDSQERVVLRLSEPGQTIGRVIHFWPEEGDWNCDCGDKEDPCLHSVAAVIAFKKAHDKNELLPLITQTQATLIYRFSRKAGFLYFDRIILSEGSKTFRLTSSLLALTSGRVQGPKLVPTKEDVAVDLLLREYQSGLVPPAFMSRLIAELAPCKDIQLDGVPIRCSGERTGFIARVEDAPGAGVRLYGLQDPAIQETFRNGAALCSPSMLRPFGHGKLLPEEIKMLAEGKYFASREFPELVSELIPALEQKLAVHNLSKHLPKQIRVSPRLVLHTETREGVLFVFPEIVYGDESVMARVVHGELEIYGSLIPIRDEKEEKRLLGLMQREYAGLTADHPIPFHGEDAVAFVESLQRWSFGEISGKGFETFQKHSQLVPDLTIHSDGKDISIDISFKNKEGDELKASSVLQEWKQGQRLVPLLEGGYAPLPLDWLERYGDVLRDLLLAQGDAKELHPCMLNDLEELCVGLNRSLPQSAQDLKKQFEDFSGIPEPTLPEDLQADLRNYQKEGVAWLSFLKDRQLGALLADDMGLGKTLQAICILKKPSLVVAPTSVIYNWEREIVRFRPSLKVCVYHGLKRNLLEDVDVVLTTYALLRQDEEKFVSKMWAVTVLDEAQNIKNPDSQVARAAFHLQSHFRITLTGTPIENSLEDVWSQFHFLNRGILGTRKSFLENYSKPILLGDERVTQRLKRRLKPFILRRVKSEVAKELPPRSEAILYCELNEEERTVYDSVLNGSRSELMQKLNEGKGMFDVLEVLLRLRQASCHRGLIPGQLADTSSKMETLISCLKECVAEGHKALVFSQWTSLLNKIEVVLKRESLSFGRIDGSTKNRGDIVDSFQNQDSLSVLLLSLKAAGTGLNLTAADHVFIVDPWWNPAIEDQAADRAYRIGQNKPVMVYRLVAKDTVEEKILLLKEKKRALANAVIDAKGASMSLSREDLLALFSSKDAS